MAYGRRNLITLLIWMCCSGVLFAGEGNQFRLLSLGEIAHFLYENEGKVEDIHAVPSSFSRLYEAPEGGRVVFYRKVPAEEPDMPPVKVTVAEVSLPEEHGPHLVVLKKRQTQEGDLYDVLVLDHSLDTHPKGAFRVFNFSNRQVAVRLSDESLVLDTADSRVVAYPDGRRTFLKVAVEIDVWTPIRSAPIVMGRDSRTTILLTDIPPTESDPDPVGVAVKTIREQVLEDEFGLFYLR